MVSTILRKYLQMLVLCIFLRVRRGSRKDPEACRRNPHGRESRSSFQNEAVPNRFQRTIGTRKYPRIIKLNGITSLKGPKGTARIQENGAGVRRTVRQQFGMTAGCDEGVTDGTITVAAHSRFLPELARHLEVISSSQMARNG